MDELRLGRAKLNFEKFGIKGKNMFTYHAYKKDRVWHDFNIGFEMEYDITQKSVACAYAILLDEMNKFIFKNHKKLLAEANMICDNFMIDKESDESQEYMEMVFKEHFMKFLKENEIEIICKIEREKSEDYPSLFSYKQDRTTGKVEIKRKKK